jgi:acetyltransferase-like isoleucine patch superfamily enzyme
MPNFLWSFKWFIIKRSLQKTGKNFKFGYNSEFFDHRLIEVGDNVFMGLNTVINSNVPVRIGNNVMFGRSVTIMGGDHNISEIGKPMRFVKTGGKNVPITIEDDVWVGCNVTILKGVTLGEGCVIGAGSVVTKSMPPYSICVGNPCKPIKMRFNITTLNLHFKAVSSKYTSDQVVKLFDKTT